MTKRVNIKPATSVPTISLFNKGEHVSDHEGDRKSKSIKDKVIGITTACNGCHYGSYPEVTISVRSPMTFAKRAFLLLFKKNKIIPKTYEEMLKKIETIINKIANGEIDKNNYEGAVAKLERLGRRPQ